MKIRREIGFVSANAEPLQIRWNGLSILINKAMEFCQSFSMVPQVVISYGENQISAKLRFIERCPNIKLSKIIADTKWIS
jgi:hypothetical protein